jgi:6-phosphofructokinase 1
MGRSVGWLAAASALARERDDDAPHLVYVPELPFSEASFLSDLDRVVTRQGWAVVVVSEGLRKEDGMPVYQMGTASQADPLKRPMTGGVGQYLADVVADRLGIRCRNEKPGLLGRCSMLHVSVQDRRDAELVGRAGVRALAAGESEKMVALQPLSSTAGPPYELVPLTAAAGLERPIPTGWISNGPAFISNEFRAYLGPLVGELQRYAPPLTEMRNQEESSVHA